MTCLHKFHSFLTLEKIDFEPTTLIVGTFNPIWPEKNKADWFYGRTQNNYFWDILPRLFGESGMRNKGHKEWKEYCKIHKIALTDLIISIEDADINNESHMKIMGTYTDSAISSKFKKQVPNDIVMILQKFPAIKTVYLTTTINSEFWQNLWEPVLTHCLKNKIKCEKLMTPSKGARFFMVKGSGISMPDFIYNNWLKVWYNTP